MAKHSRKFIRIFDSDFEIIKETKKGVLIKRGDTEAWIMRRWIDKNGNLTKSAEKALIEAKYKRKIANAKRRKIDISKAKRETEKAFLFTGTDWTPETGTIYIDIWVAKSQIKNGAVPEWIVDEYYKKWDEKVGSIYSREFYKSSALEYEPKWMGKYHKSPFGALTDESKAEVARLEKQLQKELVALETKGVKKPKSIKSPKPNVTIQRKYTKSLVEFTKKLDKSLKWWLLATIKKDNFTISKIKKEFKELSKYWEIKADELAIKISTSTIWGIKKSVDFGLKNNGLIFNEARNSKFIKDILKAKINENIALIKSIPREQILRYESVIYNDIANLDRQNLEAKILEIEKKLNVNDKIATNRARTIARDQTKKITETLSQARAQDSGYEYYVWITANDERVSKGKGGHEYLDGRIYKYGEPSAVIDSYGNVGTCGERVNCRCTSGAVYLMPNEILELVRDSEHGDFYRIVAKD